MSRTRIIVLLIALLGAGLAALLTSGDDKPYRMSLVFADAGGLRQGGDIRVRGIRAGRIDSVRLIAGDRALVGAHLFKGVGALATDASASSRPTGLLGEQFVDLDLGRGHSRLPSGARVPLSRTGNATSLDDVLSVLDAPTRMRLQILIADAGVGLAGRGTDMRRLLAELPDTARQLDLVVDQLRRRRVELRNLIHRSDGLLTPVAGRREDLGALADAASGALHVAASRRAELAQAVYRAPAALARLTATASELGDTAEHLRPTARQLMAAAPPVERALAALPAFRDDVRGVLATAATVAPRVTRFARKARRPVRQLDEVAGGLGHFAGTITPIVDVLGDGGTNQLLRFFDGFAQNMEEHDGIGSLIRLRAILGPMDPPKASRGRPSRPKHRPQREAAPAPPAASSTPSSAAPALTLPGVTGAVTGAVPPVVHTVTTTAEDLLDFLLKP